MKVDSKNRIAIFDELKGIGIILVVLGHSIQYCRKGDVNNIFLLDNVLFEFIYSFHMPLFMLVSGYLFYYSCERNSLRHNLGRKFKGLLIPIITYTFVLFVLARQWRVDMPVLEHLVNFFGNLWFLWSVLFSSITLGIIHSKFKGHNKFKTYWFLQACIIILFLLLPDNYFVTFARIKWMYLCFLLGFEINKWSLFVQFSRRKMMIATSFFSVIFLILFQYYNQESFIYTSGFSLYSSKYSAIHQLYIDVFRYMIGIFGSFAIVGLTLLYPVNLFRKNISHVISTLGQNSIGIYIFQCYLFIVVHRLTAGLDYSLPRSVGCCIVVISVCMLCISITKRSKYLSILILGV